MRSYYYDFHLHSCLSPCGDDDSTPNNIAGMAALCELEIIALTDHNTVKNCPAFYTACERYGLIPVAGMELTSSEDVHIVCLFERLEDALAFGEEIDRHRVLIENRPDIFGEQVITDGEDEVIGIERYLLTNATDLSVEYIPALVERFGGVCYPAHIDRDMGGIVAILGTVPETPHFRCVEIHDPARISEYTERFSLGDRLFIVSSDAHYLTDIRDRDSSIELDCDSDNPAEVRRALFKKLRGGQTDEGIIA